MGPGAGNDSLCLLLLLRRERILGGEGARLVGAGGVLDEDDGLHLDERLLAGGDVLADLGLQVLVREVGTSERADRPATDAPGVEVLQHAEELRLLAAVVSAAAVDNHQHLVERAAERAEIRVGLGDGAEQRPLTNLGRAALVVATLDGVGDDLVERIPLPLGDASGLADANDAIAQVVLVVDVLSVERHLLGVAGVDDVVLGDQHQDQREDRDADDADRDDVLLDELKDVRTVHFMLQVLRLSRFLGEVRVERETLPGMSTTSSAAHMPLVKRTTSSSMTKFASGEMGMVLSRYT